MSFFTELRRRNVFRIGIAYVVAAWLVAQIADIVLDNIESPDWVMQTLMLVLALGFPFALIFAWAFELTPEGIKKEKDVDRTQSITHQTGRKLDFMIIGVLVVALAYFAIDKFMLVAPVSPPVPADSSASTQSQPKSIAVLPFVNMSEDASNEYFSDGISEEILNALARVGDLKVAGRTSSFAFKGQNLDLRQIGEGLGVDHILEGSVRKAGNTIRITAQLVKVDDGFHLWSDTYDRELNDVFAIQDEIATAILEQLKAHLLESGSEVVVRTARADSEAYDLYLLAKQRMYERTGPTIESAAELLDRAIAIDPDYAPAYAQRAIAALLLAEGTGGYGNLPLEPTRAQARIYLDKALSLDPELAEAWAGMGLYHNSAPLGSEQGIKALRKALELNPGMMDANNWLLISLLNLGRPAEAHEVAMEMIERDPLYRPGIRNAINSFNWFGEHDEALAFLERIQPIIPNDATILSSRAAVYLSQGDHARALGDLEQAIELQPSNSVTRMTRGFALLGTHQWERVVEEGEEWQPILGLFHLDRTEEALLLAHERAEKLADAPTLLNFLNLIGRSAEAVAYLEERWADLDAFERDFPPYGGLGHLTMLDVALAYSRVGNNERYSDAMERLRAVNTRLLAEGLDNPVLFMCEAAHRALAGDLESSLDYLDRAIARGLITSARLTTQWPEFEPLEGNTRYEALQARMIEHLNAERAALGLEPVST